MNKHTANYITCFGCIMFLSLIILWHSINNMMYNDTLEIQNRKVMDLKRDSVFQSQAVRKLIEWHEIRTPEEQKAYIRNDKIRRVK